MPVSGTGSDDSPTFTTQAAGTYHWIAAYSGDGQNAPATTACTAPSQAVIVAKASPAVTTTAARTIRRAFSRASATASWPGSATRPARGP